MKATAAPTPIIQEKPEIDPRNVIRNSSGQIWSEFMVRLPEGMIADDLKEPKIWRKVQKGGWPLRKHDRVYVVAFDESWAAEAIVADADSNQVVLAKPRITNFPPRYTGNLLETEDYRIAWAGNGYRVQRKSDGTYVTQATANAQLAERDLRQMYAVRT